MNLIGNCEYLKSLNTFFAEYSTVLFAINYTAIDSFINIV